MSNVTKLLPPIDIIDEFGDSTLCCGQCKEPIIFPIIRNPFHYNDERPLYCRFCGTAIDWENVEADKGAEE